MYIGLDIGTSGCKAALVAKDGRLTHTAHRQYPLHRDATGRAELDPQEVQHAVQEVLKELAPYASGAKALAVSSLGEAMVIVDRQDVPLCNAIVYLDSRCNATYAGQAERFGREKLKAITGAPVSPMFSLFRLLWLKENQPQVMKNADKVFLFQDYISYLFTGKRGIDASLAATTAMEDYQTRTWSREILDFYRIDPALLSPILPAGQVLGPMKAEVAQNLGLPQLQVVVGCHDQCAFSLGCGTLQPGQLNGGMGSAVSFHALIDRQDLAQQCISRDIACEPYLVPGQYLATVGHLLHGTCIRWFAEELCGRFSQEAPYAQLETLCAPDSGGVVFLPYLSSVGFSEGEHNLRGVFAGMTAATGAGQLYRAVLEGICFESKRVFQPLLDCVGQAPLLCAGGSTKAPGLLQIYADLFCREVRVMEEKETGILGLGLLCSVACGDAPDYIQAAEKMVRPGTSVTPQKDLQPAYHRFLQMRQKMTS